MKDFMKYTFATICGIVLLSMLSGIMLFVSLIGIILSSDDTVKLSEHSVYQIRLSGTLTDVTDEDEIVSAFSRAFGEEVPQQLSLNELIENIRFAKEDDHIDGIYLNGGTLSAGYASIEALRRTLVDFKESGKFIVAYADAYTQSNYWLVSVADKVCLNNDGTLVWSGLSANVMFFTRALEKLGVEMQVVKVGTFKSAVESYMLTEMSEANRLQMTEMIEDMWSVVTTQVSQSRGVDVVDLDSLADMNMTYQAPADLVNYRLIDTLMYSQDVKTVLTDMSGTEDYVLVSNSTISSVRCETKSTTNKVAIIYAEGEITESGDDGIVGKDMVKLINKVAKDDDIKAVVLRVNSPGGSAYASEQIWHALELLKDKKPLAVSMGDYAASGGYYISCGADSIFAEATTLTGSIGIFGIIPSVAGLMDKLGIDVDGVGTNELSLAETNMVYKGMNEEERALMQGMINRGYELFVGRCADGRGKTPDQIKEIAEGRVWSGKKALEIGLVDEIGGLDRAILSAATMAGLDDYKVVKANESKETFMEMLMGSFKSDDEKTMLSAYQKIKQMVQQPSIQARIPYYIEIK